MIEVDVEKIARLAYLELSESQKTVFQQQFKNILEYVSLLDQVKMSKEEAKQMGAYHVLMPFYDLLKIDPSISERDESAEDETRALIYSNEEAVQNTSKTGGLPGALLYEVPSIIER